MRHFTAKAVILTLLLAIICGISLDLLLTEIEKRTYPREYLDEVRAAADEFGVPEDIIFAVIKTESNFDSGAVSRAGAIGLMQMMPSTFEWISCDLLREDLDVGMLYDPETNIRYGTYYLSYLYAKFDSWTNTFAAYNLGETKVSELLSDPRYVDENGDLKNIPVSETRTYVSKINSAISKYSRLYGI